MKTKSRSVLITVVAVMFALSVSYFALLAPTTAWFYQNEESTYSFTFGDFDVTLSENIHETINFSGATRFADLGETLFDEAAHIVKVDVANDGSLPAKLRVDVSNEVSEVVNDVVNTATYDNTGLRYFVYASDDEVTAATSTTAISKGGHKQAIESMLVSTSVSLSDYTDFTGSEAALEAAYDAYNTGAINNLNNHNAQPIEFNPGESKYVYIVFWIEYSDVKAQLENTATTVRLSNYGVTISLSATPDVEYSTVATTAARP